MTGLTILDRDARYVAVHKPPRMVVHRNRHARRETAVVQRVRDRLGARVYPVHRLDRAVSGVLVLALDSEAATALHDAFESGTVSKSYVALVRGYIEPEGVIDRPLANDKRRQSPGPAETGYTRLATAELAIPIARYPAARYSLVRLAPRTGRWHQLRRHLAGIDHPVIGDNEHGDREHNRLFRDLVGRRRLCLAATALTFPHPETGRRVSVEAAIDAEFAAVLEALGWRGLVDARTPDPALVERIREGIRARERTSA